MRHRPLFSLPVSVGLAGLRHVTRHWRTSFSQLFFLLCVASWSTASQRSESYETANTINGRKAPSHWAEHSCAVKSEWISRGYCLQSDAARLLWYCDTAAVWLPTCLLAHNFRFNKPFCCFPADEALLLNQDFSHINKHPSRPPQRNFPNADLFDHWLWNFFDSSYFRGQKTFFHLSSKTKGKCTTCWELWSFWPLWVVVLSYYWISNLNINKNVCACAGNTFGQHIAPK